MCVEKQRHYSVDKGLYSQGYGLPSGHVQLWELDRREDGALKNWCLWTVVLEGTPESPLDSKEIRPVNLKGNQPWIYSLEGRVYFNWCWSWNSSILVIWYEQLTHWKSPWMGLSLGWFCSLPLVQYCGPPSIVLQAYCSQVLIPWIFVTSTAYSSVQFSHSVMSDSLPPMDCSTRLPCPSPTPGACSNSCPSSWWYHSIISYSVVPFSSCLQSFLPSGSFPMSQFFTSGGQSIGASASASVLLMNIQDWFPLGLTGLISLQSKGLWRVLFSTTVQRHQYSYSEGI